MPPCLPGVTAGTAKGPANGRVKTTQYFQGYSGMAKNDATSHHQHDEQPGLERVNGPDTGAVRKVQNASYPVARSFVKNQQGFHGSGQQGGNDYPQCG